MESRQAEELLHLQGIRPHPLPRSLSAKKKNNKPLLSGGRPSEESSTRDVVVSVDSHLQARLLLAGTRSRPSIYKSILQNCLVPQVSVRLLTTEWPIELHGMKLG
jgi:hypothetical protein